jgi:hypothetical protein
MRRPGNRPTDAFVRSLDIPWNWIGLSALDRYYRGKSRATSFGNAPESLPHETVVLFCGISELAGLDAALEFPGIDGVDCIIRADSWDQDIYVMLADDEADVTLQSAAFFPGTEDTRSIFGARRDAKRFRLFPGDYQRLRSRNFISEMEDRIGSPAGILEDLAESTLIARYRLGDYARPKNFELENGNGCRDAPDPISRESAVSAGLPAEQWRYWLDNLLTGPAAHRGLDRLMCSGTLTAAFPELGAMNDTEHHKDHHPEGNVWRHTLETLKYRKSADLRLAYALLLHDAGKPGAKSRGNRRFDRHAQIGGRLASSLLRDLGHKKAFVDDVVWLVENHGYPPALTRLPQHIADPLMADPRFPLLLELYRCDISASFSGPENYYAACDIYNRYRKDVGLRRYRPLSEKSI